MRDKEFDPSTYVKVNERLAQFRKEHPEGRMVTEVLRDANSGDFTIKASVWRNSTEATGVPAATGHAFLPYQEELSEKSVEQSETVAVGRALANLGYGVEKSIASAEEMTRYKELREGTVRVEKSEESEVEEAQATSAPEPKLKTKLRFNRGSRFGAEKSNGSAN